MWSIYGSCLASIRCLWYLVPLSSQSQTSEHHKNVSKCRDNYWQKLIQYQEMHVDGRQHDHTLKQLAEITLIDYVLRNESQRFRRCTTYCITRGCADCPKNRIGHICSPCCYVVPIVQFQDATWKATWYWPSLRLQRLARLHDWSGLAVASCVWIQLMAWSAAVQQQDILLQKLEMISDSRITSWVAFTHWRPRSVCWLGWFGRVWYVYQKRHNPPIARQEMCATFPPLQCLELSVKIVKPACLTCIWLQREPGFLHAYGSRAK